MQVQMTKIIAHVSIAGLVSSVGSVNVEFQGYRFQHLLAAELFLGCGSQPGTLIARTCRWL